MTERPFACPSQSNGTHASAVAPAGRTDSPLARYSGPLRAFIGAIGHAVPDGVRIAGRLRKGRTVPALYVVERDGSPVVTWDSWRQAADALACALERIDATAAAFVRQAVPSPDGVEVTADGATYRLTVC